jgi:hypothetical protein
MLEFFGKPSSVTTFSTDLSLQNLVFWNLFEFSVAEIIFNQYFPHFESKSYQTNSIKSSHQDLSNNTKSKFQFLEILATI